MAGKFPPFSDHRSGEPLILFERQRSWDDYLLLGSLGRSFAAWPRYLSFPRFTCFLSSLVLPSRLRLPGYLAFPWLLHFGRLRRLDRLTIAVIGALEVRTAAATAT